MNLTQKKLKVSANINMAYVINYLSMYCGYNTEQAFEATVSTRAYCELMDFDTGFATAMGADILFFVAEDLGINPEDTDEKIETAFNISEKLQYCVNMTEGFRESKRISPSSYHKFLKKHKIWRFIEDNYDALAPLKKSEVFDKIRLTK